MILYTSDTHLSHANIIHYAKRPYLDAGVMDADLVGKLRAAEGECDQLIHAGDLTFNLARFHMKLGGTIFASPAGKHFIAGNHDRLNNDVRRAAYDREFESVTSDERTWRKHGMIVHDVLVGAPVTVLVSHKPQETLWGADLNVYGHVHNNPLFPTEGHHPEDNWAMLDAKHLCACVELFDGRPVSLDRLVAEKAAGYPIARAAVARYVNLWPNPPEPRARRAPVDQPLAKQADGAPRIR